MFSWMELVWLIKTGFNFTLILLQTSEPYFSLIHVDTSIYLTLAFLPLDDVSTSSDAAITALDTLSAVVLHIISRMWVYFLANVPYLHNLGPSSRILRGAGIYHLMGE